MISYKCPMYGGRSLWKQVDEQNKRFSVGKATVGGFLLGPAAVGKCFGKKESVLLL